MPVKIFTIPFNPTTETFKDEELEAFYLKNKILTVKPKFFSFKKKAYWTVWVEYEIVLQDEKPPLDLNPQEQHIFQKLKEWRKEKAEELGYPVYIICTNNQLKDIAKRLPLSLESLSLTPGFGKKKSATYGKELLEIIHTITNYKKNIETENPSSNGT